MFKMQNNDNKLSKLNYGCVTGFFDGKSTFVVSIPKTLKMKTGWEVRAWFKLGLNKKDRNLAERLQSFFGVGKVYESKGGCRV
jgi:hypothetical protein